jgi:hypothetical protein
MRKLNKLLLILSTLPVFAGNPERKGSSGAASLLINSYSRNSGMWGANTARVRGLESQYLNIAGLVYTRKTEIMYHRTSWLTGTGIGINTFGFSQGLGEESAIGFGVTSINSGKIEITTEDQPEGGLGTYEWTSNNINISYARKFSESIFGGINIKGISEGIPNLRANGFAFDAGIQYHTGKNDNIHIGIALRNWGPKMYYRGDGLSDQKNLVNTANNSGSYEITIDRRSQGIELPLQMNIGFAYDLYFKKDSLGKAMNIHRLTLCGNFTSNSFMNDNYLFGAEYAFKEMLMFRAGLYTEKGIFNKEKRETVFTGPAAGVTLELPFNEKGSTVALDYSYRFTNPFAGVHNLGFRINL